MNNERDNQTIYFIPLFANIVGILSFFLVTVPTIFAILKKQTWLIALVIIAIILAVKLFRNRRKYAKLLLYHFLNYTAPSKNYKLTEKEVIYEFLSKREMRLEKNFSVCVQESGFRAVYDKYKWTGDAVLLPESKDKEHYEFIPMGAKFGLNRYRLEWLGDRRYSKGTPLKMGMIIGDINDPNEKASPHLSSGVYERTDRLVLRVIFASELSPINARKLEFSHYTDDDHINSEGIELQVLREDNRKRYYEWVIDKPLYGGKYLIEWEWN